MSRIQFLDRVAFGVAVASGAVAAIAGGYNWTKTAIAAGCLAALAPIASRIASNRAMATVQPRALSKRQVKTIADALKDGPPFSVWVAHNRHEAEPAAFHEQVCDALTQGGLDVKWFGGMTNSTTGVEVAGPRGAEKDRLMNALRSARVKFLEVEFVDDPQNQWGVSIWIGVRS